MPVVILSTPAAVVEVDDVDGGIARLKESGMVILHGNGVTQGHLVRNPGILRSLHHLTTQRRRRVPGDLDVQVPVSKHVKADDGLYRAPLLADHLQKTLRTLESVTRHIGNPTFLRVSPGEHDVVAGASCTLDCPRQGHEET